MPTKKKTDSKGNQKVIQASPRRDKIRWININLDDDDAERLGETEYTLDSLAASFLALCLAGWDVSLKRSGTDGGIMATAITDDPHDDSGRVGVSGWSDNFPDAVASLLYKIDIKLIAGIPADTERPARRFR